MVGSLLALCLCSISPYVFAQRLSSDPITCFWKIDPTKTVADLERFLNPAPSPFQYACAGKLKRADVPEALDVRYVRNDRDTELMKRFLKSVGAKIQKYLGLNHKANSELIACLAASRETPCPEKQAMVGELQSLSRSARRHLAIVQGIDGTLARYGYAASHDAPLLQKPVPWNRYSKIELQQAHQYVSEMKTRLMNLTAPGTTYFKSAFQNVEAQDENQRRDSASNLYRLSLETLRENHVEEYKEIMGRVLLLGYIASENPTSEEALKALQQLEENRKNEEELIRKALWSLENQSDIAGASSTLLRYSAVVEEVLVVEPEFCQIASRAVQIQVNRDRNLMLGLMLPILSLSIVAPPAAAGAIFSAEGLLAGYFIHDAKSAFNSAKQSRYVGPTEDQALISREDEEAARARYAIELALAPVSFVGAPVRQMRGLVKKNDPSFRLPLRRKVTN